jgi:hypothetical protein
VSFGFRRPQKENERRLKSKEEIMPKFPSPGTRESSPETH